MSATSNSTSSDESLIDASSSASSSNHLNKVHRFLMSTIPHMMQSIQHQHQQPQKRSSNNKRKYIDRSRVDHAMQLERDYFVPKLLPSHKNCFTLSPADISFSADNSLKLLPAMATVPDASPANHVRRSITHVIFDMDGLLLDTEKFYTEVQEIILARYNKTFDWSLKAKMMGMKAIEAARVFVEETGISDSLSAEDFLVEREAMLQDMFPTSELMPGASRLIRHLHAKAIPICVATGSHTRHFELKTQRHRELFSLMHHIVRGDDPEVKKGKPSPDIFLAAANRFEGGPIDPQKALVFEDAPSGVGAAKNAGMSVVMVPDPRLDQSYHGAADQVLTSLLEFDPEEWDLPAFEDVEA